MTSFTRADDLRGAHFDRVDLRGARFVDADLSGAVLRGVDLQDTEIDTPWLYDGRFLVNGIDVVPLVRAELERRFPGRSGRYATDPDALREAWTTCERAWAAALERVATLPAGTVDRSVDGEWSFAETLRHLVLATDVWLRRAVQGVDEPYHPLGLAHASAAADGLDMSVFTTGQPTYDEVLAARADRAAQVREFLAGVTAAELAEPRANPWAPDHAVTVLSCLQTILEEEWEHLRYAVRDLDALQARKAD